MVTNRLEVMSAEQKEWITCRAEQMVLRDLIRSTWLRCKKVRSHRWIAEIVKITQFLHLLKEPVLLIEEQNMCFAFGRGAGIVASSGAAKRHLPRSDGPTPHLLCQEPPTLKADGPPLQRFCNCD